MTLHLSSMTTSSIPLGNLESSGSGLDSTLPVGKLLVDDQASPEGGNTGLVRTVYPGGNPGGYPGYPGRNGIDSGI